MPRTKWPTTAMALASLCIATSAAKATTYYVGPRQCDDGGAGTSGAAPWCTIGKANATLVAGDTVLIAAGTYGDQIRPVNDGSSDTSRITYRALGDGNVILTAVGTQTVGNAPEAGAIALGGKSFVTVDGTHQSIRVVPGHTAFAALANFTGASSCVIDAVYFDGSTESAGIAEVVNFNNLYGTGTPESRFNVLRNSALFGRGDDQQARVEDLIHVAGNAHHNLIEKNDIENSWHLNINCGAAGGSMPHDNVIRQNVVRNRFHSALSFYQNGATHNLVEGNILSATWGAPSPPGGVGNALQASPVDHVIRYNVIERGGSSNNDSSTVGGLIMAATGAVGAHGAGGQPVVSGNRVYHNTIVKHQGVPLAVMLFSGGTAIRDNRFLNNFFYGVSNSPAGKVLTQYWDTGLKVSDRFIRNVYGTPGGSSNDAIILDTNANVTVSLAIAIATLHNPRSPDFRQWRTFANVYDAAPGFANYKSGDYSLPSGNAYIDTAAPLTTVAATDAGSGTTLVLDDARLFWDGSAYPAWMGIESDTIAVGTIGRMVQIKRVDARANIVTLASSVPRSAGDPIWVIRDTAGVLRVKGTAPDVGALESASRAAVPRGTPSPLGRPPTRARPH